MSEILRADGTLVPDVTRLVRTPAGQPERGDVVPLASFLALTAADRAGVGVWLAPDSEPSLLAPLASELSLVAVDFPTFKDGRGFSTATLLRTRYGFRGDLRAIGDVLVDQLFYMRRVGFSSFALRADQDAQLAVQALRTFTDVYQTSFDQPQPWFRRRAEQGARP